MPPIRRSRVEFVAAHLSRDWKEATNSRARYLTIQGFNLAVMTDHNDRTVWTWCLTPQGCHSGEWSDRKYSTECEAKQGGLEHLATKLGILV